MDGAAADVVVEPPPAGAPYPPPYWGEASATIGSKARVKAVVNILVVSGNVTKSKIERDKLGWGKTTERSQGFIWSLWSLEIFVWICVNPQSGS